MKDKIGLPSYLNADYVDLTYRTKKTFNLNSTSKQVNPAEAVFTHLKDTPARDIKPGGIGKSNVFSF